MLFRKSVSVTTRLQLASPSFLARRFATATKAPKLPFEASCASVTPPYERLVSNLKSVKRVLDNEPLTLAEKILYSHLVDVEEGLSHGKGSIRRQSYLKLNPDRVAMQGVSRLRLLR